MPANSELTIPVDQPLLWNAETPYLYEIYLESDQEVIRQALGLRHIEIRDQIFYVNQVPVKLIGVNQHAVSYTHLTLPTILRSCRSRWSPYH